MLLIPSETSLDKFKTTFADLFNSYQVRMVDMVGVFTFPSDMNELFEQIYAYREIVHVVDLGDQYEGLVVPNHPQIIISSQTASS